MEGVEMIVSTHNHKVLKKKTVKAGNPKMFVVDGAQCELAITDLKVRDLNGECAPDSKSFFFAKPFSRTYQVGKLSYFLDKDFEHCLLYLCLKEKAEINLIYHNEFGQRAMHVCCLVEILDLDKPGLFCDWSAEKKLVDAEERRATGVICVNENNIMEAFSQFSRGMMYLLSIGPDEIDVLSDEDKVRLTEMKIKLYNNLAACHLRHDEFSAVINLCNAVLELDKNNIKALYRRGRGHMGLKDWQSAFNDINRILTIDPTVSEAKTQMRIIRPQIRKMNADYNETVKKMFR